ncbi:MAG: hypothetical protein ACOX4A_00880 [Saccharofermentanales bacterium]|jgi:hypothetical protein
MNLIDFFDSVQKLSESLSSEALQTFVFLQAAKTPAGRRRAFLKMMQEAQDSTLAVKFTAITVEIKRDLADMVRAVSAKLEEIAQGERCLGSEVDWEQQAGWYDEDVAFVFSDRERVLRDINDALRLIDKCIDCELYDLGYHLAEQIACLEVCVTGDYFDYSDMPMNFEGLQMYDLIDNPRADLVAQILCLTYMANDMTERPAKIYEMMQRLGSFRHDLTALFRKGDEIVSDFTDFLPLWLTYLASLDEERADSLLGKGISLVDDMIFLCTLARHFGLKHPRIYKKLLERLKSADDLELMLAVGMEAVDRLPVHYVIRSDIALLTAESFVKLDRLDRAERYWFEAFQSDSSIVNYLRLRSSSQDYSHYADRVHAAYVQCYRAISEPCQSYDNDGRPKVTIRKNNICSFTYISLLLFEHKFEEAFNLLLPEFSLQSFTAKEIIPLALLFFFQGSDLDSGLTTMLNRVISLTRFSAAAFNTGGAKAVKGTDAEVLWNLISRCKVAAEISEAERKRWLEQMELYISTEVHRILSNQDRKEYTWAAAFLAALGEVQESCGQEGGKDILFNRFRAEYPRLSKFKREISRYGGR